MRRFKSRAKAGRVCMFKLNPRILYQTVQRRLKRCDIGVRDAKRLQAHTLLRQMIRRMRWHIPLNKRGPAIVERQRAALRHSHAPFQVATLQRHWMTCTRRHARQCRVDVICSANPIGELRHAGKSVKVKPARPIRPWRVWIDCDGLEIQAVLQAQKRVVRVKHRMFTACLQRHAKRVFNMLRRRLERLARDRDMVKCDQSFGLKLSQVKNRTNSHLFGCF